MELADEESGEKELEDEEMEDTSNERQRNSNTGMKYNNHSDKLRIDLLFDIFHHEKTEKECAEIYGVKYNTIRNIKKQFEGRKGETYKHARKYADINNVTLKVAQFCNHSLTDRLAALRESSGHQKQRNDVVTPRGCSLYLFNQWDDG